MLRTSNQLYVINSWNMVHHVCKCFQFVAIKNGFKNTTTLLTRTATRTGTSSMLLRIAFHVLLQNIRWNNTKKALINKFRLHVVWKSLFLYPNNVKLYRVFWLDQSSPFNPVLTNQKLEPSLRPSSQTTLKMKKYVIHVAVFCSISRVQWTSTNSENR